MTDLEPHPGAIYWLQPDGAAMAHPHVVIQVAAQAVVLCALTSNRKRVSMPGNVLLDAGEANLSRQSVVEVSKQVTVDAGRLGAYIGTLSERRMAQIWAGIRFVRTLYLD